MVRATSFTQGSACAGSGMVGIKVGVKGNPRRLLHRYQQTHPDELIRLSLEHFLDGACRRGELNGERHAPAGRVDREVLHEATGHNVLPKVRINDVAQLAQDLILGRGR